MTGAYDIIHGDVLTVLRDLPDDSFDALLCDPPYGFSFMGKKWDYDVPSVDVWRECLRVLKPGAPLLAFGGARTFHRIAVGIEDAGFDMRDVLMWLYGRGFPKSQDVSKAIDKAAGHWRGRAGAVVSENAAMTAANYERTDKGEPITAAAAAWDGYGTALKPAYEPIILARKPVAGTMVENIGAWGVGGLDIDGCRVGRADGDRTEYGRASTLPGTERLAMGQVGVSTPYEPDGAGRWPANLILDEHAGAALDASVAPTKIVPYPASGAGVLPLSKRTADGFADAGGPSRFFTKAGIEADDRFHYCAKVSTKERERGCDTVERIVMRFTTKGSEALVVQLLVDTAASPPRAISVSGISISSEHEWSTFLFGSSTTDPSLQGCRFTTRTKTSSTIGSKTWSCLARWNTSENTEGASCERDIGGSPAPCAVSSNLSIESTGTSAKAGQPTLGASPATCEELFRASEHVELVVEEALPRKTSGEMTDSAEDAARLDSPRTGAGRGGGARCHHPTLKPLSLTKWLSTLIKPPTPGACLLVPYSGAGSEMIGALKTGWPCVLGIEGEAEYIEIARARIAAHVGSGRRDE